MGEGLGETLGVLSVGEVVGLATAVVATAVAKTRAVGVIVGPDWPGPGVRVGRGWRVFVAAGRSVFVGAGGCVDVGWGGCVGVIDRRGVGEGTV